MAPYAVSSVGRSASTAIRGRFSESRLNDPRSGPSSVQAVCVAITSTPRRLASARHAIVHQRRVALDPHHERADRPGGAREREVLARDRDLEALAQQVERETRRAERARVEQVRRARASADAARHHRRGREERAARDGVERGVRLDALRVRQRPGGHVVEREPLLGHVGAARAVERALLRLLGQELRLLLRARLEQRLDHPLLRLVERDDVRARSPGAAAPRRARGRSGRARATARRQRAAPRCRGTAASRPARPRARGRCRERSRTRARRPCGLPRWRSCGSASSRASFSSRRAAVVSSTASPPSTCLSIPSRSVTRLSSSRSICSPVYPPAFVSNVKPMPPFRNG